MQQSMENEAVALLRGKIALEARQEEKTAAENKENAHIIARKFALDQEKIRSAHIAKLPKPVDPLEQLMTASSASSTGVGGSISNKATKLVSLHDADAFMTTRYHMPTSLVDKADQGQTEDARQDAQDEAIRLKMCEQERNRASQERMEKARLRGKHALDKEILAENYADILGELNVLQQADREKRQKELIHIPKEIFLPAWQREQNKNEMQLDMERKFEKIYEESNLRSEEMPAAVDMRHLESESQSNFEDADLDLTILDEVNNQQQQLLQHHSANLNTVCGSGNAGNVGNTITVVTAPTSMVKTGSDQSLTCAAEINSLTVTNASQPPSQMENTTLNKLLEKIRKQREEYVTKSSKIHNVSIDSTPGQAWVF